MQQQKSWSQIHLQCLNVFTADFAQIFAPWDLVCNGITEYHQKKWGIWKKWRKKQKGIWQLLIRNYQNADLTAANKPMTSLWAVVKKEKEFAIKIKGSTFMWQRERISLKSYTRDTELYRQNFTELFQSQLLIVVLQNNFSYTFHKTPSKTTATESFQKHPVTQKTLQCYYWWRGPSLLFSWQFSTLSRREIFQDTRSEFY